MRWQLARRVELRLNHLFLKLIQSQENKKAFELSLKRFRCVIEASSCSTITEQLGD